MARIVVIGDLMTDTVAHATLPLARGSDTPAHVTTHGGGSGANVAAWLGADGADVAFIGRRGADIAGRNRDMELMGYSVDARLVMDPERPTGTCVVMVTHKGERTMMSDPGANAALSPDDLPHDLFVPGAHLHVSGYTLLSEGSRAAALAALDFAAQVGMSTSVDGASAAPLERVGAEPFFELTGNALLLFVNVAQARVLTGRDDPEAAARVLTAWYPQVVIKLAENGALFFANGRPPVRVPAPPVDRVIDGTGAGDAFVAGFLPPWLDKKPPTEALASGCRLAAHALNLIGARPILLRHHRIRKRRRRRRPGGLPPARGQWGRDSPIIWGVTGGIIPRGRQFCGRKTGMAGFLTELFSLERRVAVVTGGSSGIGEAMASALALAGAQVVIVARDPTRLSAACKSLRDAGCAVAWVSADLSDRAEVRRGASAAAAAFGEPDILVNCAGVNLRPALASLSEEHWDLMTAVNLTAPFLLGQRFGPAMASRGWGRIINVTSQQALRAFGNSGGYGVSKGGLASLTRSQSEAWAGDGVCVNSLCPGFVATPLTQEVSSDPVQSAALAKRTHIGRNGEPSDFAGVAVFLASTASDYITGQTIYVDGGFSGA